MVQSFSLMNALALLYLEITVLTLAKAKVKLTFWELSISYDPILSSGLLSLSTRTPSTPLVGW